MNLKPSTSSRMVGQTYGSAGLANNLFIETNPVTASFTMITDFFQETEECCLVRYANGPHLAREDRNVRGYWRLTKHPGRQGDKPHPTHAFDCNLPEPSLIRAGPLNMADQAQHLPFLVQTRDQGLEFDPA